MPELRKDKDMITPQEIRGKGFETVLFKGYEMGAVDDYMDTMANEVAALQTEIITLKTKMKVLVDKIEEYRSNQDAISTTMVQAQQISAQTESDARARAANIIAEAEAKAAAAIGDIDDRIALEEARLQEAKLSTAKFFDSVRALCKGQLANLDALGMGSKPSVSDDAMRIQAEVTGASAAPAAASFDSDSTQVFSFSKES